MRLIWMGTELCSFVFEIEETEEMVTDGEALMLLHNSGEVSEQ
jgi:hypothetical protein